MLSAVSERSTLTTRAFASGARAVTGVGTGSMEVRLRFRYELAVEAGEGRSGHRT